jgi:hypothetical protein
LCKTSRVGSDNGSNNNCDGNNNIGGLLGRILDQECDVITERRMDPLVVFSLPPDARCEEDGHQAEYFCTSTMFKILLASNLMFKIILPTAYCKW